MRRGVLDAKIIHELPSHPGKSLRGRTPYPLFGRFRFLNQRRPGQRARWNTTVGLLLEPSSEGSEERYPKMEKLILALVTTAKRLRPYFQAHTIEVLTQHLMKQILHKLETSGRLIKWAIELSEFDIKYKPRTTVKGQVLVDFIVEFTPSNTQAQPTETTQLAPDIPI